LVTRSLRGTGFATRISSMLESYAALGHELDVLHYRFVHEHELPAPVTSHLTRYVTVPLAGGRYRRHASHLPPLAWQCLRAQGRGSGAIGRYELVQAETSATWSIARTIAARRRLAVLHDDDAARLRTLANIAPGRVRRLAHVSSARKYEQLQGVVLEEADRIWFVSEIERDRLAAAVAGSKTDVIPNGARDEYWSVPLLDGGSQLEVLFVGPGSYEANSLGLAWFLGKAWPIVRRRVPAARLRIVGLGWEHFGGHPDASFAGWSESLLGDYSRARVVIAPLFAGGGTKIKVLEAMAAARPVVTTPSGAEGLPTTPGLLDRGDTLAYASDLVRFLTDEPSATAAGIANRAAVEGLQWSAVWRRAAEDLADLVGADA
jgi:glycosyltransferase involved in cell wall biosynthesis